MYYMCQEFTRRDELLRISQRKLFKYFLLIQQLKKLIY